MNGWQTLLYKEVLRFWKVSFQTVAAPVLTAVLYLLIFGHVLEGRVGLRPHQLHRLPDPGLVMMSVLQNAFANSSSSLVQSKIMGSWCSCCSRRCRTGPGSAPMWARCCAACWWAGRVVVTLFCHARLRRRCGFWCSACWARLLGTLGLIAGLWAEKFDQMAAFQNF
jgi:ABC-2 type transport system permease protein